MIVIEGTVRLDPDRMDETRPEMEAMVRASRAEAGCIDYAYAIDLLDPGLVRVSERWESREALTAHFRTPHMAHWRGVMAGFSLRDRSLRLYEADPEDI